MGAARIVLAGVGSKLAGLRWEFDRTVRLGRQVSADIVLGDYSVERVHVELKNGGARWFVRDLANNPLFPTLVNGVVLSGGQRELHQQDLLQLGQVMLKVTELRRPTLDDSPPTDRRQVDATPVVPPLALPPLFVAPPRSSTSTLRPPEAGPPNIRASCAEMQVQLATRRSWEQALEYAAAEQRPERAKSVLTLLRANQHLGEFVGLPQLLQGILTDALGALGAQRGAILIVEPSNDQLVARAVSEMPLAAGEKGYSRTLADRCFQGGESFVCNDIDTEAAFEEARRIKLGGMASVVCALLRTPHRRLGVLHLSRGPLDEPFNQVELQLADAIAASVAVGIECGMVVHREREQLMQTMGTLVRAVEMRDEYCGGHSQRVADYAQLVAQEMNLAPDQRYQLQLGTLLYDIGKIGIDEAILRKPGKLSPAEFDVMKAHTTKGAGMIGDLNAMQALVPIVRHHHEHWDGTGYPDRIGKDDIALSARIVAVADSFDAMTSHRPYRPALPAQKAFWEILAMSGTHFDPACVQAFLRVRRKVEGLLQVEKSQTP